MSCRSTTGITKCSASNTAPAATNSVFSHAQDYLSRKDPGLIYVQEMTNVIAVSI